MADTKDTTTVEGNEINDEVLGTSMWNAIRTWLDGIKGAAPHLATHLAELDAVMARNPKGFWNKEARKEWTVQELHAMTCVMSKLSPTFEHIYHEFAGEEAARSPIGKALDGLLTAITDAIKSKVAQKAAGNAEQPGGSAVTAPPPDTVTQQCEACNGTGRGREGGPASCTECNGDGLVTKVVPKADEPPKTDGQA